MDEIQANNCGPWFALCRQLLRIKVSNCPMSDIALGGLVDRRLGECLHRYPGLLTRMC